MDSKIATKTIPLSLCLLLLARAVFCPIAILAADWNVLPPSPSMPESTGLTPVSPALAKSLGDAAEQVARWQPPANAAAWEARRPVVAAAFRRAIGLEIPPERTPLNARIVATNRFDNYWIENLIFESRPGFPVTANVYRPALPATGRRPAVLSPIGHFLSAGKTATDVQARCIQLARLGFVVLVYDALGQGERMFPGNIHHDAGYALLPLGETIAGWMVWDSIRALDYLVTRDDVDADRIGLTGNSGGGLNTLFTAALDERIHAAVVVGFTFEFGNWLKYGGTHCTCTHLPGLFGAMNWFEIGGLIAPRALMMLQGENDGIFPVSGAQRSGTEVERLYRLLEQPERARFVALPNLPHAYSRPFRETMIGWMTRHLQDRGQGEPVAEETLSTLPEKDPRLLCDPSGRLMASAPTVVDLARQRAAELIALRPDPNSLPSLESTRQWARRLTTPPTILPRLPPARVHRREAAAGGELERFSFTSEDGVRLPGLLWRATNPPSRGPLPVILIVNSRGKAATAESGLIPPLLAAGYAVAAVDLRARGELLDFYGPNHDINFRLVANQVLSGQPLAGRRAFDLRRALDYLAGRPEFDSAAITVVGLGEDALPALLAAVTDDRIRQLAIGGLIRSWRSLQHARTPPPREKMGDAWNDPQLRGRIRTAIGEIDFGSVIPSALATTDLPELARAFAPRRLLFCEAPDQIGPDAGTIAARFQAWIATPGSNVQHQPDHSLPSQLLGWLKETPPSPSPP